MDKDIYNLIINSEDFKNDRESLLLFKDSIEYLDNICRKKKQFDLSLYKTYITEVKGHKAPNFVQFGRLMLLFAMCGYNLKLSK